MTSNKDLVVIDSIEASSDTSQANNIQHFNQQVRRDKIAINSEEGPNQDKANGCPDAVLVAVGKGYDKAKNRACAEPACS